MHNHDDLNESESSEQEPQARMVRVGNETVALVEQGQGPPLLMLPAAPAWSFIYREFMPELARHYRCIAVDFPGFGLAPEPEGDEPTLAGLSSLVEELICQLDLDDVTLLVHDTAGCIGLGAAGRLPERVRGLVLTDTLAWPLRNDFPRVRFMLRLVTSWPLSLLQTCFNLIPWAAITTAKGSDRSPEQKKEFVSAFGTRVRRRRVLTLFRGLVEENAFLERVEGDLVQHLAAKPVLVMFGENDPARIHGFEARWQQLVPEATFAVIPEQMHFPHFAAAKEMSAHILAWREATANDQP